MQIQYDMRFLFLDGVWRLNALSVDAVPVQQPVASAMPPAQNATPQTAPATQAAKPSNAMGNSKGKKSAQPASQ
jgi:hypothetical protein